MGDEIFDGTNPHDKLVTQKATYHNFSERRNIGIVATHEPRIMEFVDGLQGFRNIHFTEELSEQGPVRDFKLKPGRLERSNAVPIVTEMFKAHPRYLELLQLYSQPGAHPEILENAGGQDHQLLSEAVDHFSLTQAEIEDLQVLDGEFSINGQFNRISTA